MGTIASLQIKTVEQMRDDYLRTYRNSLILRGIADPDVSSGTEVHARATALAQQVYGAAVSVPIAADAQMADTAQGDDLVRVASIYRLALRPAAGSTGPLVLAASVSTPIAIPAGAQLLDAAGLTYVVAVGGSYTPGASLSGAVPGFAPITITSQATGLSTNLTAGSTLRWVSPPPYCAQTAAVDLGGLTGGADAEVYEGLRARLLERLQSPPNGVNWASVNLAAEGASAAVQKAFTYAGANGPSTMHAAVARAPTASNKGRAVDPLIVAGTIVPAVYSAFPEFVSIVTTTVQNSPVDVSIGLALPASPLASPGGPGGGWVDGVPFPLDLAQGYADVTAVTSSTVFSVRSPDAVPVVGDSVCWLSRDDWQLRTARITAIVAGGGPIYAITIDTPFVGTLIGTPITVGDYLFPAATNMPGYVAAALASFAAMGPGEKLAPGSSMLPRARRRPLATQSWPSAMTNAFLRPITDVGEEVAVCAYLARSVAGPLYAPPYPALITDGPFVFTPGRLAFYPL